MLEKYIPKRFANALIKHVMVVTLLFPYYYSIHYNIYCQDFILAIFFAVLFMITVFTSWKLDLHRNIFPVCIIGALLIVYNGFATYMNYNYHHWYGEQINTTLSFLFFIVLLLVKDSEDLIDEVVIKATIHTIVITNILALMYRSLDKYGYLLLFNTEIRQGLFEANREKQFSWLYAHKSQYALLLVLCVAFFVVYRKYFRNIVTYCLSQGLLLVALFFSTNYVCMAAALVIFAAQFADFWWKAKWKVKVGSLAAFAVPFIWVVQNLYERIAEDRNILTLGSRTVIWTGFWQHILDNPNGVGTLLGSTLFDIGSDFMTNNCHNVFLNHMFRFSIPVGTIYSILFLVIIFFCIKRKPSFLTLGIWVAILMPMNMDFALFTSELPFMLFVIYCIFFRKSKAEEAVLKH